MSMTKNSLQHKNWDKIKKQFHDDSIKSRKINVRPNIYHLENGFPLGTATFEFILNRFIFVLDAF